MESFGPGIASCKKKIGVSYLFAIAEKGMKWDARAKGQKDAGINRENEKKEREADIGSCFFSRFYNII